MRRLPFGAQKTCMFNLEDVSNVLRAYSKSLIDLPALPASLTYQETIKDVYH